MKTKIFRQVASFASACLLLGSGAVSAKDDTEGARFARLSGGERLTESKQMVSDMQDTLRRVVELQELAKKRKDIIKLNCVNDRLIQVRGHMAVTDQATSSLNEYVAKQDDRGSQHELARVSILRQKVLVLRTEAENCIGEDLSYVGATTVTVEIDPLIPESDPTAYRLPILDLSRPPIASPSL